jgi:alanine-synthesizing transaminase
MSPFLTRMNYLSSKLNFDRTENELAKLLHLVKTQENFIDLTSSNPTLFFEYETELIQKALSSNNIFPYAPDPNGLKTARLEIVKYYQSKGRILDVDNLFFTSGTSEAMSFILKAICNFNSEILLPTPGYPLYDFIVQLENTSAKNYILYPESTNDSNKLNWKIDFEKLEQSITKNTKAIVIVEPHNPTGSRLNPEDAARVTQIANDKNLILIIDEVFSDYYPDYYPVNPYLEANCIYLNGLSKTLALPQLKLSWIYLSGKQEFVSQLKEALEIISDTYLSVNTPVQTGLEILLQTADSIQNKIKTQIKENKKIIYKNLKDDSFIDFFIPEGGWYLILKLKTNIEDETFSYQFLNDQKVYTYPGYMFDMPGDKYIVISLLPDKDSFEEGIKRLIHFFELIK